MTTQTQSIIVYRNPAEQMMWESGYMFPAIATAVVFIALAVWLSWLVDKLFSRFGRLSQYRGYQEHARWAGLTFAVVIAVGVFAHLTRFM